MNNDSIFLYIIAAAAVVYAIGNAYGFFVKGARCTVTEGTVYSIWTPGPEKMRFRNSKWAKIAYKVNGKRYISYNRIQIPMSAEVGTKITIRYDALQPDMLYSFSWKKIGIALAGAAVCVILGVMTQMA